MGLRNTFSNVSTDVDRNNVVYVEGLNAFTPNGGPSSMTIPTGKEFIATQLVDLEDNTLDLGENSQTTISSLNPTSNGFTSALASGALITGSISRFIIQGTPIISTTGTAAFMAITKGVNIVPTVNVNNARIQNFSSIGSMVGGNFFLENVAFILNDAGVTFEDMSIVTISEANFVFQGGDHITFTGTLLTGILDKILTTPASGFASFNLDSALDISTRLLIKDTVFSDAAGGTLFKPGGLDQTDPSVIGFNNGNELDSCWVGVMGFADNATETVIATVDTYTDIAGTISGSPDNERFTLLDGVLTYIGLETRKFMINVNIALKKSLGASARTVRGALFTDTGSGFIENGSAPLDMDNNIKSFGFNGVTILNTGDKLKVQIKNETNEDNILVVTYDFSVNKA